MGDDKKLHDIEKMDFVNIQSSRRKNSTDIQNKEESTQDNDLVDRLLADAPDTPEVAQKAPAKEKSNRATAPVKQKNCRG